jgi:4-hydroxyproline epimerase
LIHYTDLHTEGEPTRVITSGFPDLGAGTILERCQRLQTQHWDLCSGIVREPRGHEAMVAALLLDSEDPRCDHGVIFFNNVGPLGMCGHGTMGVVRALHELGQISQRQVTLETPAGMVEATLEEDGSISVINVESHCFRRDVVVELDDGQTVSGDIAWGGNWFFLTGSNGLALKKENLSRLIDHTVSIRKALEAAGITGEGGAPIDHVDLHEPLGDGFQGVRCFVLCPGLEWDRSPCGTGTSATVACQVDRGLLKADETWVQESLVGGRFEASWRPGEIGIIPTIRGRAWPCSRGELLFESDDPFRHGFPSQ